MLEQRKIGFWMSFALIGLATACQSNAPGTANNSINNNNMSNSTTNNSAPTVALEPTKMTRVGEIDERYQSYNVEMLEVTGGKFSRPYSDELMKILTKRPCIGNAGV